ncbi:N-6 DNA methylase [Lonepinella sp. BR2474]|uniref:N-6 DNA methylase n=1 Tax=Lonepinella sp. BR2474 TaxID=3434548 RepID=UPI003F6E1802
MAEQDLIISKQRVKDFGEVFTPTKIVKAMLDMVYDNCLNHRTTFYEPSCGIGNFLVEILNRKLWFIIEDRETDPELTAMFYESLGSLYGVDIQEDNVLECRSRLKELFVELAKVAKVNLNYELVDIILSSNIRCANALNDTVAFARVLVDDEYENMTLGYYLWDLKACTSQFFMTVGYQFRV